MEENILLVNAHIVSFTFMAAGFARLMKGSKIIKEGVECAHSLYTYNDGDSYLFVFILRANPMHFLQILLDFISLR